MGILPILRDGSRLSGPGFLLNGVDLLNPVISAIDPNLLICRRAPSLVGRPIGVNLEPVDASAQMNEERQELVTGRQLNVLLTSGSR